jgi:hypothetical protein
MAVIQKVSPAMRKITLSADDWIVEQAREYAREHRTSLNAIIRDMLAKLTRERRSETFDDLFTQMDKAKGNSRGKKWRREELHRA